MTSFSERQGLQPRRDIIQLNSMDDALRTGLWNALSMTLFQAVAGDGFSGTTYPLPPLRELLESLWIRFFKRPLETLPKRWIDIRDELSEYFVEAPWYKVYDFVEFCAANSKPQSLQGAFIATCDAVLQVEMSAYRFIDAQLTPITSEGELGAIDEALDLSGKLSVVSLHLATALRMLSSREKPDFRNSVKESISAVESMCSLVAGQEKADLSTALKRLEKKINLHKALKNAFVSLYGYTSDEGGIRHALLDESEITFGDAKFMLVSCSAFVNYLTDLARRGNLLEI